MRVTLYKSSLCPRCHLARKSLEQLSKSRPELVIEYVDVLAAPLRAWRDGIRMIPAIKVEDKLLTGIYLSAKQIASFLTDNPETTTPE